MLSAISHEQSLLHKPADFMIALQVPLLNKERLAKNEQ